MLKAAENILALAKKIFD